MRFNFKYTGMRVRDIDASVDFYTQGLGMREERRVTIPETGGGLIVYLKSGDHEHALELNWYPPGSEYDTPYEPGEALDHLAFDVEGGTLEDAIHHLEAHGGKLVIPPFKELKNRIAYVDGPDGHTVELVEPLTEAS